MKKIIHSSEQGQALVLLVFAVVGLLGFTALAIDGGMVYADRRHAQNAVDASSLAGGAVAAQSLENSYIEYENFDCDEYWVQVAMAKAKDAAISRAGSNDYGIDKDISDDNGVVTECVDNFDNGSYVEKYIDVRTRITKQTRASFVHFVYKGPLVNTVEAVTRVWPNTSMAFGSAIVSTSVMCDGNEGGVTFDGGGNPKAEILVNGGGIFTNSCLDANGGPKVTVKPGRIGYMTDYWPPSSGSISPDPQKAKVKMPNKSAELPGCADLGTETVPGGKDVVLEPGNYDRIRLTGGGSMTLKPGLYCVTNEFTANNGTLTGYGVTIYVINGDVSVSGNVEANLSAPTVACETEPDKYCPPALAGMLFYLAEGNTGAVDLQGNSESHYTGTIFAPDGTIDLGGNPSLDSDTDSITFNTQLVGDTVKIHGNVKVDITFNGSENYHLPATLELFK